MPPARPGYQILGCNQKTDGTKKLDIDSLKTKALELDLTPLTTATVYRTEVTMSTKSRDLGDEKEKCLQALSTLGIQVNPYGFWVVDQAYAFLRLARIP